jgi:uncharacterized oxidoreductase
MKTSGNTILITGGGSGIGFETAKLFSQRGNTVIITGRDAKKLKDAVSKLDNTHYIVADVTNDKDLDVLVEQLSRNFPKLNVLMNNAGRAVIHKVSESADSVSIAREEMETNYFAVINLTSKLLPLLKKADEAAVINVSSIVAFAPGLSLPTYSASKAALHSYSQVLRLSLGADSNVKVFEVMPPLVDTEFAKDIPSDKKISPADVAVDIFKSVAANNYEVRVASTEQLYQNFLGRPDKAALALNGLSLQ